MKKVCMLCSHHSPLDARVFYKEAMSLQKNGFGVTIVAPISNRGYFRDIAKNEVLKADDDFSLLYENITLRGFRIKKFPIPKINYWINLKRIVDEVAKVGFQENADVYHCHEFVSLIAGVKIKKQMYKVGKKVKLIYDAHEYWPGIYQQKLKNFHLAGSLLNRIISYRELQLARLCDFIITANHIVRSYFLLHNRFSKVEVIYNCPNLELFKVPSPMRAGSHKILCHEGNLRFDRGLQVMFEVLKMLKQHDKKFKLLIVGDVFDEERKWFDIHTSKYSLDNDIKRTGWLPYEKVGENVAKGDIGIIFMKSFINNMLAGPPNKLFNYMRYGLPVIAPDFPELRRIILNSGCGTLVDTSNAHSVCKKIICLCNSPEELKEMSENGMKAVINKYNWKEMEKRLIHVYKEILDIDE